MATPQGDTATFSPYHLVEGLADGIQDDTGNNELTIIVGCRDRLCSLVIEV